MNTITFIQEVSCEARRKLKESRAAFVLWLKILFGGQQSIIKPKQAEQVVPGANRKKIRAEQERFFVRGSKILAPELEVIFVEQNPQIRKTQWCFNKHYHERTLSFPRIFLGMVFFRGDFARLYAFFMKEPYSGLNSPLYQTILPNNNDSGWVCIGNDQTIEEISNKCQREQSLEGKIRIVLDYFWNKTAFNDHIIAHMTAQAPNIHPNLRNLATWERTSRSDPNFILSCNWQPAGTVNEFFSRLRRDL
jgi:hypothetical protein